MDKRTQGIERYWVIDPGETLGHVVLEVHDNYPAVLLAGDIKIKGKNYRQFCLFICNQLQRIQPTTVVIEDYRVYAYKAEEHIGSQMFTSKQIATFEALCAISVPPVPTVLMPAAKKKRFPIKRLKTVFPEYIEIKYGTHARDALLVGLAYLEKFKHWKVEVPDA